MANEITIGLFGGYASGKATFINALLGYPYFIMSRVKHNSKIITIQGGKSNRIQWLYKKENDVNWQESSCSLRHVKKYNLSKVSALIPYYDFSNLVFQDFPIICSEEDFPSGAELSSIDFGVIILDAEYAEKKIHYEIIKYLAQHLNNNLLILLNKSELLDSPKETILDFQSDFHIPAKINTFPISAQLELERILDSPNREKTYAYTRERKRTMYMLDACFSEVRTSINFFKNK